MSELFRCARSVPETTWKRINVQAEVWYSPAPPKKRKKEFETEIQPPMATSEDERQPAATFVGKQSERGLVLVMRLRKMRCHFHPFPTPHRFRHLEKTLNLLKSARM